MVSEEPVDLHRGGHARHNSSTLHFLQCKDTLDKIFTHPVAYCIPHGDTLDPSQRLMWV